jgi:hypothetical protein
MQDSSILKTFAVESSNSTAQINRKDNDRVYFIYNPKSKDKIEISFPFIPDEMSYSYSANFQSQNVLGRISPVFLYTNGSAIVYAFSVNFHEDLLPQTSVIYGDIEKELSKDKNTTNMNIVDFVEKIKMLSYPIKNNFNEISFTQVYFQLGEIAGYGFVKTSIQWQKPYRNGHYTNCSISFEFTQEIPIQMPELQIKRAKTTFDDLVYDYQISLNISASEARTFVANLNDLGYNTSISDLLKGSEISTNARINLAKKEYDYTVARLEKIYGIFASGRGDQNNKKLELIHELNKNSNQYILNNYTQFTTNNDEESKKIKDIKENFLKYLDYYYNDVNKNMTRAQFEAVKNEVFGLLEDLQRNAEERVYAASR